MATTAVAPPSIAKRVPFEKYAAIPRAHITQLKELARSAKHFRFRMNNPKESKAMALGSAAHTAILEPHRFMAEYALWDERTEEGKLRPRNGKLWDAFVEKHAGRKIVKADEHAAAMAMRDAVRSHPDAGRYIEKGDPEVVMTWVDAETGRACKGRLDWLNANAVTDPVLVGVKTARDCRPIPFGNAAAKLGYHLQWAFYFDGYKAITGLEPRVVEIVVENAPPYDVAVYRIPTEVIEQGRDEYRQLLVTLAACEESGTWPGAVTGEQVLSLPSWIFNAEGDLETLGLEE